LNKNPGYWKRALEVLINRVSGNTIDTLRPITYSELSAMIGLIEEHPDNYWRMIGNILGDMGDEVLKLADDWGDPIPHLQSLIVNKSGPNKGLPSKGIQYFWADYPELSKPEKINRVKVEYERIVHFGSRWNKVLIAFGLQDINLVNEASTQEGHLRGHGGESPQHKALKDYVAFHPELVGALSEDKVHIEYAFPSGDTVDVLFKNEVYWIAVEVKSQISDRLVSDYERGVYQCVKYGAILDAMKNDHHYQVPSQTKVVLLLESKLPKKLRSLVKNNNIPIVEDVQVTEVQSA